MFDGKRVTAVIPALNEAASITKVLTGLWSQKDTSGRPLVDEVIVCDNGSEDQTGMLARFAGATVVVENQRGYGAACQKALAYYYKKSWHGDDIIVFVDADHSVDTNELASLLAPLREDADLVIGDRSAKQREPGSMSPQQVFGNWFATWLIRLIWREPVNDLGPFRAIRAGSLKQINMQDRGFGWTCEMQIRAIQERMRTIEVPSATLRRIGKSKISGTLLGSLRAGHGILGMVWRLWRQGRNTKRSNRVHTLSRRNRTDTPLVQPVTARIHQMKMRNKP